MSAYNFQHQLIEGEQAERVLDRFFSQWYTITPATRAQQRLGIDRVFTSKASGVINAIEYKSDWTASSTGNAFVETVSVDTANKPGWIYTSTATYLMYYLPDDDLCYALTLTELRRMLPHWLKACRSVAIPNRGYKTHGLLVPLKEFERIAYEVVSVG